MNKEEYINKLAINSKSINHELIEECLIYYDMYGTKDLTVKQLKDYCDLKNIV